MHIQEMEGLRQYIGTTLGDEIHLRKAMAEEKLPLYIRGAFAFYRGSIQGREVLFARLKGGQPLTTVQIEKQLEIIRRAHGVTTILVADDLPAIVRNRLIQKRISFVVPGKQMYLPTLLVDLQEVFHKPEKNQDKLLPVAQVILLFHILNKQEKTETYPLKKWAARLNYTAMAITQAAENLKALDLCAITGTKEKYLVFAKPFQELWKKAEAVLINPVIKRVYVDSLPAKIKFTKAGETALAGYTNMNASRQEFRAMGKATYYEMVKKRLLVNPNDHEGAYCLEVWKYDPAVLGGDAVVDEISLYLSLRHNTDERIQMALGELADLW